MELCTSNKVKRNLVRNCNSYFYVLTDPINNFYEHCTIDCSNWKKVALSWNSQKKWRNGGPQRVLEWPPSCPRRKY